jgi:tetratricopeptide (TPR) repeat protein
VASAVGGAERCAALTAAAMVHNLAGRWAQALALAEQALQAATAEGSLAETAAAAGAIDTLDAERARGLALSQLGRPAEAVDTLRGALARAGTCAPARRRIELQAALAYALNMLNRLGECSEVLQRTITLAAQEGDLLEVMSNRQNLAALQAARGRAADGLAHARAAQQLRDQLGDAAGPHGPMNQMAMGSFCIQLGRYGEALALLEAVLPVMQQQLPFAVPAVHNFLAQLWLLLGQWGRARALLEPAADPDPNGQHGLRRAVLRARLQRWQALQLARGVALPGESADESAVEPTEGHAALATELQQALQAAPPGVDERQQLVARLELSRVQPGGEALALVRQVQQRAAELQADGIVLHARQLELQHLLPLDPDHALRLARELARAPEDVVPTDGYLPELWWLLACCAAREGRPAQQAHWLQQARRWIEAAAAGLPAGLRSRFLQGHPMQARVLAARSAA